MNSRNGNPKSSAPGDDDIFGYKPFVDGLRAISILSVVAYHLRIPGVTGGFVGVDVFFVLSGYLIINQILAGLKAAKFSFAEFWARRVLRILPRISWSSASASPSRRSRWRRRRNSRSSGAR